MVSYASMIGMLLSMILYVAVMAILFVYFYKKSKVVESGYWGAFGLGASAYFWAMVLLLIGTAALIDALFMQRNDLNYVVQISIVPLLSTLFATLGCVWANWLTNRKKVSYYRGIAVGLGFGFAEATLYYIIPNVINVQHAFEINNGTYHAIMENSGASTENIQAIYDNLVETNPLVFMMGGVERLLITLMYVSLLVILSKYMQDKSMWKGIGVLTGFYLTYMVIVTVVNELSNRKIGNVSEISWSILRYLLVIALIGTCILLARRMYQPQDDQE